MSIESFTAFATEQNVDLLELAEKIRKGLAGVSISHFTDEELMVLREALEAYL